MPRNLTRKTDAGDGNATLTAPPKTPAALPTEPAVTPPAGAAPATSPAPPATGTPAAPPDVQVHVEVICGGITNVKAPVAIAPRYQGLALKGPARAFDRLLDSWLTRAFDMGMIGSGLGQLFPIHLEKQRAAGKVNVDYLLMVGMGEPGRFSPDDLRFLMSNVTVAVLSLRQEQLSTELNGTRRKELTVEHAARALLEGILDGYVRFRAIVEEVRDDREQMREASQRPLFVKLVALDEKQARDIVKALEAIRDENSIPGLQLEAERGHDVDPDPVPEPGDPDTSPDMPVSLLRVTRSSRPPAPAGAPASPVPVGGATTEASRFSALSTDVFEFSALSEVAAVTVREVEVNSYLVRELPQRITGAPSAEEQESFGTFFADYLIPRDFRGLTEGGASLTLIVDETTAAYPWEMAAHYKHSKTSFLGTSVGVSRQFRTLLSPPPTSPPPLNRGLRALVIADPAAGNLSLPHARVEALAVLEVMDHARKAWDGEYQFEVTVRVGSCRDGEELDSRFEHLSKQGDWIESVDTCDPLELARLIVTNHYDVIHYAGHGLFDRRTGRAGWVFDRDCFLSGKEIFRVRKVPRLVFANACFSAVTADHAEHSEQRAQLVGLAQAFFARGIPNYIGTGWEVKDACAPECARWFYTRVLGLHVPDNERAVIGTSPPATIGAALLEARRAVHRLNKNSSTWGAYQHYGRVNDKLLALPNARRPQRPGANEGAGAITPKEQAT